MSFFVFVGTKDYATGLLDANSAGFGVAGSAASSDVSSWYPTKQMVIGSGYITSADISDLAASVDVASWYPTKAMVVGSGYATNVSALAINFIGF